MYDNGRLVNQSEMVDENEDEERDPGPMEVGKKQREVKEIVSEEVYNSGLYSSEKSLPYVSQFENKMRGNSNTPKDSRESKKESNRILNAENYIDPVLLNKKSNFVII